MMSDDSERIEKSIVILQKIAKGINPVTGEPINDESFLNDPRIIRCFFFVTEILKNVTNGSYSNNKVRMPQRDYTGYGKP